MVTEGLIFGCAGQELPGKIFPPRLLDQEKPI
jgi:hypothetical protein